MPCQPPAPPRLKPSKCRGHPEEPYSNVLKYGNYNPDKYFLGTAMASIDEALLPGRPPTLTQNSIQMYLRTKDKELNLVPPRPTLREVPPQVIERMVARDRALWVPRPGEDAYGLHDRQEACGMTSRIVKPVHQAVFPRSYQLELPCVRRRVRHACDSLPAAAAPPPTKELPPHCRACQRPLAPSYTPFQLGWISDAVQKRWRHYPDHSRRLTQLEIRDGMREVGRPFRHEACTFYNENFPSRKVQLLPKKFGK